MKTIHALLVAIDNYPVAHHRLNGCVNDRNAFQNYLDNRINQLEQQNLQLRLKTLTDAEATREGFIDGFQHFAEAKDGDICLLYYSGHGSQMSAPTAFHLQEPDHMLESVVCYDSRIRDGRDLYDKELAYLIWQATHGKEVKFLSVFDCCHSGGITKDIRQQEEELQGLKKRAVEPNYRSVELRNFAGFEKFSIKQMDGQDFVSVPLSDKAIHLSAAKSKETAKELYIDGVSRGIFTYTLLDVLERANDQLSYKELVQIVGVRIANKVQEQAPQLSTSEPADKNALFLNGVLPPRTPYYRVNFTNNEWQLNAGAIQGIITSDSKTKTTLRLQDGEEIYVEKVYPNHSLVAGMEGRMREELYEATLVQMPLVKLKVAFAKKVEQAGAKMLEKTFGDYDWPDLEWVKNEKKADYLIRVQNDSFQLTLPNENRPVFRRVQGYSPEKALIFLKDVETVARWKKVLDLSNPRTSIKNDWLKIELFRVKKAGDFDDEAEADNLDWTEENVFHYDYLDDEWQQPAFRLKITNTSNQDLTVSALYLQTNFDVSNRFLPKQELAPGQSVFMTDIFDGESYLTIPLELDDRFHAWNITEITEHIKIIVSTDDKLNTDDFNQEGLELDVPEGGAVTKAGRKPKDRPDEPDWTTFTIPLTIVRPMEHQEIWEMQPVDLLNAISLKAPEGFRATATISNQNDTQRAVGQAPPLLAEWEDVQFTEARDRSPGLSVLELYDLQNADQVQAAHPLEVQLKQPLAKNEIILPIGYDPELNAYLPLGKSDANGLIHIDTLPAPSPGSTRSLGGSIKIFFKKVLWQPLFGAEYEYPVLAQAVFTEGEEFEYETDTNKIKQAVAKADRIVLFIHGIIGDTTEMPKAMKRSEQSGRFADSLYDVALTFDYENLKTGLDQTARDLKARLEAVGLSENHGKTLHIVAHSMGGLISRWMIEKEGGNKIVSHLVQLGTPNNGSAWSSVYELTTTLLGKALKVSALLKPWAIPLIIAGRMADQLFSNLQQMHHNSDFLKKLNDATDPDVPYSILAGNTSLLNAKQQREMQGVLKKTLARFKNQPHYKVLDALIFQQPNDIAVSVESILGIPGMEGRSHKPIKEELACDHISYFHDPKGLEKLTEVLFKLNTQTLTT